MTTDERDAEIRRLFFGEHWPVGTIAEQLSVHRDVVKRIIEADEFANAGTARPSALDPYVPFMRETLERFPTLTGARLHRMLVDRGYPGSAVQVRRRIRREGLRARKAPEAFFELRKLPGEEAQVDWMHVGRIRVDGVERKVSALLVVLSYSRAAWVHFSLDEKVESVLRGHVEAFEHFGGVPRVVLYDNMKTAVIERRGDAIRFHARLLQLAGHYLFSPTPCGPYRPHEKGRVERRVRDLRSSMLAGLCFSSLDDLRRAFRRWQQDVLFERTHPRDKTMTVREAFERERTHLLPLPDRGIETDEIRPIKVGRKQPYVHYDTNRYSVPAELVGCTLTLTVSDTRVRLLDGQQTVAEHTRCWGRRQRIDDPAHLDALAESKRKAASARGRDRVMGLLPIAETWYRLLAKRGLPMGPQTRKLLTLIEQYPLDDIDLAIEAAIERETLSADSIARLLEQAERQRDAEPAVPVRMPAHVRDVDVKHHNLGDYDDI
jgi:transposase